MKGNRELDDLLVSYILKELSSEEEDFVIRYISADEKNRLYFEELKNAWKLLTIQDEVNEIDVSNEWKYFKQTVANEDQHLKAIKSKPETDPEVSFNGKGSRRLFVKKVLIPVAVAASVIGLIFSGWFFKTGAKEDVGQVSRVTENIHNVDSTVLRREVNKTGKPRKLLLHDGSEIVLADKSEVSYYDPFISNRRDIILKGKADFKVAKDKTKPFTVYSLDVATTALGTQFSVSAFEDAVNTVVRLNEGKVVVNSTTNVKGVAGKAYYLVPGEELVFNNLNYTARVLHFNKKHPPVKVTQTRTSKDSPEFTNHRKGSWYMFNNQSLGQVFDQLSMLYSKQIVYSKKDLQNLYFIGSFNKSDALRSILTKITSLNNLKLTQEENRFTISK
ncbi:MAG TPA: FecR domain-containing protein [Flavitalea sp.]|nr:FecR domain-containing protein [Flavitalea sp.]